MGRQRRHDQLNSGTLSTARQINNGNGGQPAIVNFNGGTLQAAASNFNILYNSLTINVGAQAGGAIINTNGYTNVVVNSPLVNGTGGAADGGRL